MTTSLPRTELAAHGLILRPLAPTDRAPLFAVASDPEIWAGHPAPDRWQEPQFVAFFNASLASGDAFAVIDAATGAIIGHSRFARQHVGEGEVEIGSTFLSRAYWGGATNAVMKALMIGHALTQFDRVLFLVGEANLRSRRAMAKIGGVLTDRELMVDTPQGLVRHVIFAIDANGFAVGPLAALLRGKAG